MDIGDGGRVHGVQSYRGSSGWRRTAAAAWRRAHRTVILKSAMLSARGQAVLWRQCEPGWLVGRRLVGSGSEDCGQCRPRLGWCRARGVLCLSGSFSGSAFSFANALRPPCIGSKGGRN